MLSHIKVKEKSCNIPHYSFSSMAPQSLIFKYIKVVQLYSISQ